MIIIGLELFERRFFEDIKNRVNVYIYYIFKL
jgi:hypothetical protein